jgi:Fe-S-cluster containining protein
MEAVLPGFYALYEAYVRAVTSTSTTKVTCSRGCGHCCSHYVSSVEPFELVFLHGRIRSDAAYPSRLVAFHRRSAAYKSLLGGRMDEQADDKALFRYYLRNIPCPFLTGGGECGIYESRPMSCRMFFSQSHPSLCRGKAAASPGNRNFIVELPDDIEASIMRASERLSAFELPDSLFEGLLEANARFGRFDADGEGRTGEG